MKLLFVYIHEYKSLKKQSFNLSSDYEISFDYLYNPEGEFYKKGGLKIEESSIQTPKYFNKNFSEIKGVIGENGAGKSSLIQYLGFEMLQREFDFFEIEKYYNIAVYKENDKLLVFAGKDWNGLLKVDGVSSEDVKYLNKNPSWFEISGNCDIIYYSNVFDKESEFGANELINISTNYKLSKSGDNNFGFFRGDQHSHQNDTSLSTYFRNEMMEMVRFSTSHNKSLPFKVPDYVTFYAQGNYINRLINVSSTNLEVQYEKEINTWISLVKDLRSGHSSENFKPIENFIQVQFFSYMIYNLIRNSGLENYFEGYSKFKIEFIKLLNKEFRAVKKSECAIDIAKLLKQVKNIESKCKSNYNSRSTLDIEDGVNTSSKIKAFLKFQDSLSDNIDKSDLKWMFRDIRINRDKVHNILDLYDKTLILGDYLSYRFRDLSSGELGMLTLFSRFHALTLNQTRTNNRKLKVNLVILIDEGDLYFHPAWQKKYLSLINKVLPKIFTKNKIQLILTSHSPFIASDLTKNHLLFMEKEKGVINPDIDRTFAANIHELLSESFFLKGAHIGDLAKEVIEAILDKIEEPDNGEVNYSKDEIKSIIPLIGEEWIRRQLENKLSKLHKND